MDYDKLKDHVGHEIVCVGYIGYCEKKEGEEPENVAIECETCNEVLVSFDKK